MQCVNCAIPFGPITVRAAHGFALGMVVQITVNHDAQSKHLHARSGD
jgi:hypothetical protein